MPPMAPLPGAFTSAKGGRLGAKGKGRYLRTQRKLWQACAALHLFLQREGCHFPDMGFLSVRAPRVVRSGTFPPNITWALSFFSV